jgi:hypothetical protein
MKRDANDIHCGEGVDALRAAFDASVVADARAASLNGHEASTKPSSPNGVGYPPGYAGEPIGAGPGPGPDDPTPLAGAVPTLEVLDVGDDDRPIPPRQWLLGNAFCREFVSAIIAPGAGGKTSLRIVQALALATGRSLTGEYVFERCRVLFVCLEDGMTELRRRVRAAMKHHKIEKEEVKDHLFLTTPRSLKLAQYDAKGSAIPGGLDQALRALIDDKAIDQVFVDPVKKCHSVKENDNDAMDAVITIMAQLAVEKKIGFDYASHEAKASGGEPGDPNRARGAGAMKDGGRLIYTLTLMTLVEAQTFGVPEEQRRTLFRVDSAKFNLGPPQTAMWFRFVGVRLGNGDETYPNGDEVQTVERWKPPQMFDGFSTADLDRALEKLAAGMAGGRRYSAAPSAKTRAAWRVLHEIVPTQSEMRCRAVITHWVKNNILTIGKYHDEKERKEFEGIVAAQRIGE